MTGVKRRQTSKTSRRDRFQLRFLFSCITTSRWIREIRAWRLVVDPRLFVAWRTIPPRLGSWMSGLPTHQTPSDSRERFAVTYQSFFTPHSRRGMTLRYCLNKVSCFVHQKLKISLTRKLSFFSPKTWYIIIWNKSTKKSWTFSPRRSQQIKIVRIPTSV